MGIKPPLWACFRGLLECFNQTILLKGGQSDKDGGFQYLAIARPPFDLLRKNNTTTLSDRLKTCQIVFDGAGSELHSLYPCVDLCEKDNPKSVTG
jgi:hypothetical protein